MGTKIGIGIAGLVVAIPILIAALVSAAVSAAVSAVVGSTTAGQANCVLAGSTTSGVASYGPDQIANAATIVAVGKQMNVPEQGWVVAIAAAIQESGLRNLDYGDRDSLGLFQQRPSQGWGRAEQVMNPTYAATQFYQHLLAVPGWQQMSVNDAAQTVQRSGTPHAYAQHEHTARGIVGAVHGSTCATDGAGDCDHIHAPNPVALAAINYACGHRGLPYMWGGGPQDGGFDCSGLAQAAYNAAGISLPRTAQTQYSAGSHVPNGQPLLPGDLVFYGTASNIHHVGLYIGNGQLIHAPTFDEPVQTAPYRHEGDDYYGATRPSI